ncbi:protein cappuccino-like [Crassostrea angulata]|uniref:protein cappuccino-like n=1 Tax=Magallana angulata TaxID=2784310 RepID=UPI0022B16151|nr:protein cappuccino-like [Crassostrea angulata]
MSCASFELSMGTLCLVLLLLLGWGLRCMYHCCRRRLTARRMRDNTHPKEEIEMGVRPRSMPPPPPPSAPPRQALATVQTERTPQPTVRSGPPPPPPARGGGRYHLRPAKRPRTD